MMTSVIRATAALTIAGLGATFVALPAGAVATTTPSTDQLYMSDWSEPTVGLFQVTTPAGGPEATLETSIDSINSVRAADYDSVSGQAFLFGQAADDYWECSFVAVNLSDGTRSDPIAVNVDGDEAYACDAVDITDGVIRLAIASSQAGSPQLLGTIDPTTGDVTDSVLFTGDIITDDYWFAWIATDPTTGITYGGTNDNVAYTIDVSTGATERVRIGLIPDDNVSYAADFDSTGTLWMSVWPGDGGNALYAATPGEDFEDITEIGVIQPEELYNALFFAPAPAAEPELASTGSAAGSVAPIAIAVLLLGGAAVVLGVVLRRRNNP